MTLPTRLQTLVEESLKFVNQHPQHNLNLGYRYAIYTAMGTQYPSCLKQDVIGYKRRTYLNIVSVQKILPYWRDAWDLEDSFPEEYVQFPQTLLGMASDILLVGIEQSARKWLDNHLLIT